MWYRFSQNNDFPEEIDLENIKVNPYSEDVFPMSENYSPSDVVQHIAIVFKMKIDENIPELKKIKGEDRLWFIHDILNAALRAAKDSVVFLKEMGYPVNFQDRGKPIEDVSYLIDKAYQDAKNNTRNIGKINIHYNEIENVEENLSNFWKFFRDSLKHYTVDRDVNDAFDTPTYKFKEGNFNF